MNSNLFHGKYERDIGVVGLLQKKMHMKFQGHIKEVRRGELVWGKISDHYTLEQGCPYFFP